jgi:hypothetical protein
MFTRMARTATRLREPIPILFDELGLFLSFCLAQLIVWREKHKK